MVDHLLCEVSQYTEGQNTSFIDKISTYDEEGLSLFVYHDQMSIGGVKGMVKDVDFMRPLATLITKLYPWHDRIEKYMRERIRWVLLM